MGLFAPHGSTMRPETSVKRAMCRRGYPTIQTDFCIGLHDYAQYYAHIFRKVSLLKRKFGAFSKLLPYWRDMERNKDFAVALLAAEQNPPADILLDETKVREWIREHCPLPPEKAPLPVSECAQAELAEKFTAELSGAKHEITGALFPALRTWNFLLGPAYPPYLETLRYALDQGVIRIIPGCGISGTSFSSKQTLPYVLPKPAHISFRRWHLDAFLAGIQWSGRVLDVGGRKWSWRGAFRPPFDQVESWEYVNINPAANPDYLASADALPIAPDSKDIVLLSEVLEHLRYPEKAICEAYRVLRKKGSLVCAAPFLYPFHADPDDYQRWLPAKYLAVLREHGFSDVTCTPMGSLFSVLFDLIFVSVTYGAKDRNSTRNMFIFKHVIPLLSKACTILDKKASWFSNRITTGYFVIAVK
jgi:SAM-dependent methyltransferase